MGFPHSEIFGSKCAGNSPRLFAACHVLHRLSVPRHPPNALKRLIQSQPSHTEIKTPIHDHQLRLYSALHLVTRLAIQSLIPRSTVCPQRVLTRPANRHSKATSPNSQSHSYPQCQTAKAQRRSAAALQHQTCFGLLNTDFFQQAAIRSSASPRQRGAQRQALSALSKISTSISRRRSPGSNSCRLWWSQTLKVVWS